ncbi:DNA-directed RNA polymerase subunit beta [Bacillus massiliigorillae]|uniref:DNA-directed RNA polymerase subunit beta n=1 Tax=Bacillus massiliigorillae TaxID=1243664 RepID=UPI000399998E|nr:DNA-directed RNA polymerase subunit beta [Bacillus massiliigorillae]
METKQLTREEFKQEQQPSQQDEKPKKIRIRLIPIWLRIVIVILAIVFAVTIGCVVGYSVIGEGKPSEVFQKETWSHIFDLVKKDI